MDRNLLTTKRLTVIPASDEETEKMIAEADTELAEAYRMMLNGSREHPEERLFYTPWMIFLRDGHGKRIGDICFKGLDENGETEIGYGMEPGYEGKGYMTEAVGACIGWAFTQPGVHAVTAETAPDNAASKRILEKFGFIEYGQGEEGPRFRLKRPARLFASHPVFPVPDIEKTAEFYREKMGFTRVDCLAAAEPHICLYRDGTEIILTDSHGREVVPNRVLYGYGGDAYFITDGQETLENEFRENGVKIAVPLRTSDYHNKEFAVEDCDGRLIYFGIKQQ